MGSQDADACCADKSCKDMSKCPKAFAQADPECCKNPSTCGKDVKCSGAFSQDADACCADKSCKDMSKCPKAFSQETPACCNDKSCKEGVVCPSAFAQRR